MNKEILDNHLVVSIKKYNLNKWVAIILLWISIGYCTFNGLISEPKVVGAIGFLLTASYLTHYRSNIGLKFTLTIIILGVFDVLDFLPIKNFITISIGPLTIWFEFYLLFIGIIHIVTNRKELYWAIKAEPLNREELQLKNRSKIEVFKRRFSSKSIQELALIYKEQKLIPPALNAVKELLSEKKVEDNK